MSKRRFHGQEIYWNTAETPHDWRYSDKPLSEKEFFAKYGVEISPERSVPQFLTVPIGSGRNEFEQLLINNHNQLFASVQNINQRLCDSTAYKLTKRYRIITALAITSTVISLGALIACISILLQIG